MQLFRKWCEKDSVHKFSARCNNSMCGAECGRRDATIGCENDFPRACIILLCINYEINRYTVEVKRHRALHHTHTHSLLMRCCTHANDEYSDLCTN